jgi:hypothetical protein
MHRRALWVAGLLGMLLPAPCGWAQLPPRPMDVVSRFCQADGHGYRLRSDRWAALAPLVKWILEPAWDHASLISGYQVHSPRFATDHVDIKVEYTVTADVSAAGVEDTQRIDTVNFRLVGDDVSGWRIDAPPPPPYVFANEVDPEAMRASLDPDSNQYLSGSKFVWRMLRDAGWPVPYRPLSELRDPDVFAVVADPKAGDVALFLSHEVPYHVGFVIARDQIASATLNAGLMRTPADAFPGTVMYLRLKEPRTPRLSPPVREARATPAAPRVEQPVTGPTPPAGTLSVVPAPTLRPQSKKTPRHVRAKRRKRRPRRRRRLLKSPPPRATPSPRAR